MEISKISENSTSKDQEQGLIPTNQETPVESSSPLQEAVPTVDAGSMPPTDKPPSAPVNDPYDSHDPVKYLAQVRQAPPSDEELNKKRAALTPVDSEQPGAVKPHASDEVGDHLKSFHELMNKGATNPFQKGELVNNAAEVVSGAIDKGNKYANAAVGGVLDAIQNTWNTVVDLSDMADDGLQALGLDPNRALDPKAYRLNGVAERLIPPSSGLDERILRGATQFASSYWAWGKAIKGSMDAIKGGAAAERVLAGAGSGATALDPSGGRLADLLDEVPYLRGIVPSYLVSKPGDTHLEGRLKNAIENLGLGIVGEGVLQGIKAYKAWNASKAAINEAKSIPAGPISTELKTTGIDLPLSPETQAAQNKRLITSPSDFNGVENKVANVPVETATLKNGQKITISTEMDIVKNSGPNAANEAPVSVPTIIARDKEGNIIGRVNIGQDTANGKWQTEAQNAFVEDPSRGNNVGRAMYDYGNKHVAEMNRSEFQTPAGTKFRDSYDATRQANMVTVPAPEPIQPPPFTKAETDIKRLLPQDGSPVSFGPRTTEAEAKSLAQGITGEPQPPYHGEVNVDLTKMVNEDSLKKAIAEVSFHFEPDMVAAKGGVRKDELVNDIANILAVNPEDLLSKGFGAAYTDREVFALKKILDASVKDFRAKALNFESGTDADKALFIQATDVMRGLFETITGARAESGRSLRAWSLFGNLTKNEGEASVKELLSMWGKNNPAALAKSIAKLPMDSQIFEALQPGFFSKLGDAVQFVQINGLLSGYHTHAKNFISNSLSTLAGPIEHSIAESMSSFQNRFSPEKIYYGHAGAQYVAMIDAVDEAFRVAKESFVSGESKLGLQKYSQTFATSSREGAENAKTFYGSALETLKGIISIPTRALMASDDAFKVLNIRASMKLQAIKAAENAGLRGSEFSTAVDHLINSPTKAMKDQALIDAHDRTFTSPLEGWQNTATTLVRQVPGARFVIPFMKTNLNIVNYNIERSPLAPLLKNVRDDIAAGGTRGDMALSKMSLGMATLALGVRFASEGKITGKGAANADARKIQEQSGWRPYSIFDQKTQSYKLFDSTDPFFNIIAVAADMESIMSAKAGDPDFDWQQMAVPVAALIADHFTPSFLVDKMGSFHDLLSGNAEDTAKEAKKMIIGTASTFLPFSGAYRMQARLMDPVKRDVSPDPKLGKMSQILDGVMNRYMSDLPGYSKDLPPVVNIVGEPVMYPPGYGWDVFSAFYTSKNKDSPMLSELIRLGMTNKVFTPEETPENQHLIIKMPPKFIDLDKVAGARDTGMGLYKLNGEEYRQFVRYSAGLDLPKSKTQVPSLEQALTKEISQNYPSIRLKSEKKTDEMKKVAIAEIIKNYRNNAADIFYRTHLINGPKGVEFMLHQGQRRMEALGITK